MRKTSLALFLSMLTFAGAGFAATPSPTSEITESTDPAKADEVMRRASEIQARQQAENQDMTSGSSSGKKSGKSKKSKKHSKSTKHEGHSGSSGSSSGADASSGASSPAGQDAGSSTSK